MSSATAPTRSGDSHPTVARAGHSAPGATVSGVRSLLERAIGRDRVVAAIGMLKIARGKELRAPFPLRAKLSAWPRGFRAETAMLYDLARNDWRDYVSDYQRVHRCKNINPLPELFGNKLFLKTFLEIRRIAQAETIAVAAEGAIELHPLGANARYLSAIEFEQWLVNDGGQFILKPLAGTRGDHVYLLRQEAGKMVRQRGHTVQPFNASALRGVSLVERLIPQGTFWSALSPASANTIRVITMWTPGDAAPFVGFAVQRMGTASTAPADNWSGGGICAPIDLPTGRMGRGRMHPLKGDRPETEFSHHPDSGVQIEGAIIPYWDRVCETALAAAHSLPSNRYVGWDILVNTDGVPVIIEGNSNTDVNLLQVHGGLLRNPAVRRFYEQCGII